ncbi:MAG: histidinol dehydrogenase, partial [Actinomycetota bacterium]|nr:histidinol dehydrogenase [Actinomycetota bacterium]
MSLNFLRVDKVKNIDEAFDICKSHFEIPTHVIELVDDIISNVKQNGEKAVIKYTNSFDKMSFR